MYLVVEHLICEGIVAQGLGVTFDKSQVLTTGKSPEKGFLVTLAAIALVGQLDGGKFGINDVGATVTACPVGLGRLRGGCSRICAHSEGGGVVSLRLRRSME
jgi:hypothetical protein